MVSKDKEDTKNLSNLQKGLDSVEVKYTSK
jgi:hypothetical protein